MTTCCEKCGNADNFDWQEIQKGKPWLVKCLECGHSWTEEPEKQEPPNHNTDNRTCGHCEYFRYQEDNKPLYWDCGRYDWPTHYSWVCDSWQERRG